MQTFFVRYGTFFAHISTTPTTITTTTKLLLGPFSFAGGQKYHTRPQTAIQSHTRPRTAIQYHNSVPRTFFVPLRTFYVRLRMIPRQQQEQQPQQSFF